MFILILLVYFTAPFLSSNRFGNVLDNISTIAHISHWHFVVLWWALTRFAIGLSRLVTATQYMVFSASYWMRQCSSCQQLHSAKDFGYFLVFLASLLCMFNFHRFLLLLPWFRLHLFRSFSRFRTTLFNDGLASMTCERVWQRPCNPNLYTHLQPSGRGKLMMIIKFNEPTNFGPSDTNGWWRQFSSMH